VSTATIDLPETELAQLCQRWHVRELALFGSTARNEAGPNSDVDLLVSFEPENEYSLFDIAELKMELESMLGREVDLVERDAIVNPYRRRSILRDLRVLYAAS
jgi:predicted nucleotidyltransferase